MRNSLRSLAVVVLVSMVGGCSSSTTSSSFRFERWMLAEGAGLAYVGTSDQIALWGLSDFSKRDELLKRVRLTLADRQRLSAAIQAIEVAGEREVHDNPDISDGSLSRLTLPSRQFGTAEIEVYNHWNPKLDDIEKLLVEITGENLESIYFD